MRIVREQWGFLSIAFFSFLSLSATSPAKTPSPEDLRVRPYIIETVRAVNDVSASLEVNHSGPKDSSIVLGNLTIVHEGENVLTMNLDDTLFGDEGRFVKINAYLEKLPPRLSFKYRHRVTPLDSVLKDEKEIYKFHKKVTDLIDETREFMKEQPSLSLELVKFVLPLQKLFSSDTLVPGNRKTIKLILKYQQDGKSYTKTMSHTITVAEPFPRVGENWYYGDLHVHDCKDEAALLGRRGCPSCPAESLNWGDDNTLTELKTQYQAKGATWFTSTNHSYCINSEDEYNEVKAEAEGLSGSDFLLIPDTELSSKEEGPYSGLDWADLLCWIFSRELGLDAPLTNHTGAHWIQSRKTGGNDSLIGFCKEPMEEFRANITAIRAEGGFTIANHPASSTFEFNSVEWARGWQAPDGLQGVEIWNGPTQSGQEGDVGWWVKLLLRGEMLYAYSGSDTHDDVFDFGWNFVYVEPGLAGNDLKSALKTGRLYISSYQAIVLYGKTPQTDWKMMGSTIEVLSDQTVELKVDYDMGEKVGSLTIYEGHVGEESESVLCSFSDLTGAGENTCTDDAYTENRSYYRVYSETSDGYTAYSNPIFINNKTNR